MQCISETTRYLRQRGYITCENDDDSVRLLDRHGRLAFDLNGACAQTVDHAALAECVDTEVTSYINEQEARNDVLPQWVSIDACIEALELPGGNDAISRLCAIAERYSIVSLIFHYVGSSIDCDALLRITQACRRTMAGRAKLFVGVRGSLNGVIADRREELFAEGVALQHVPAGTARLRGPYGDVPDDLTALQILAEYGFHIPIVWYATDDNLELARREIDSLMDICYYAGVSAPLASANPYYLFGASDPALPSSGAYSEFLTWLYTHFQHYDAQMAPVNELALLATLGGWSRRAGMPRFVRLSIDEAGAVGLYRQTPALSRRWATIATVSHLSNNQTRETFLRALGESASWEGAGFCETCQSRDVCGGLDWGIKSANLPTPTMVTMCGYRMLFLEHFARAREPAFDLAAALSRPSEEVML